MSVPGKARFSRDEIVGEARRWLGTPYHHQASVRGVGCDCLGLIRGVYRALHGHEPEAPPAYSPDWAEATATETLLAAARRHLVEISPDEFFAGDVLLFRWRWHLPAKHAAIATSEGTMIHALDNERVLETAINSWWRRHLIFAFSFPGVTG